MSSREVVLYFDDQSDALRFALAAGSVMSGENQGKTTAQLIQETQRARRVKLGPQTNPEESGFGSGPAS